MQIVKRVFAVLGFGVLVLVIVALGARFGDGPTAVFPGGPLEEGELITGSEPDWTFARDIPTMEVQLLNPPQSRNTWPLVHDKKLYAVSLYMNTPVGRVWKQWPLEAEQDNRAVIRIDGKRHERELKPIQDNQELFEAISVEAQRKLGAEGSGVNPAAAAAGDTWFFAVGPRLSR